MVTRTHQAINKIITDMRNNIKFDGIVRVVVSKDESVLNISFDNRKYIGRLDLEWKKDHYDVYFVDRNNGKIKSSEAHASKSVYMRIDTVADARKFVKLYMLITQLAAMGRNRTQTIS